MGSGKSILKIDLLGIEMNIGTLITLIWQILADCNLSKIRHGRH